MQQSESMRFHFTIDVDWIPGSDAGLSSLLSLCRKHELPSTLFVAGRFAEVYPDILREACDDGCDIGCHGMFHGVDDGENFRDCSYGSQKKCIERATAAIDIATGVRPVMFRAPNLWTSETMMRVLVENDYRLDSSVPAQRFDFWYGQCSYVRYYRAPLKPYHPSPNHLGKRGDSPLLEVTPSAYGCIPINMSALRVFGFRPVAWAIRRLAKITPVLVFYSHPAEFVNADQQDIPSSDPKRYREGIGPQNLAIVEQLIEFVSDLGYKPARMSEELSRGEANEHRLAYN